MNEKIKPGGVIRYARAELGMSQSEFGRWLGEQIDRSFPVDRQVVSKWERGVISPRLNCRVACRELAARRALRAIDEEFDDERAISILIESQS